MKTTENGRSQKTYSELIKEQEYKDIANILYNNKKARDDNRVLIKEYYRSVYGLSLDEAFSRNDIPNYQSIERKARLLKAVNHSLRVDKNDEVDKYRTISTEIPVAVTLF